MSRARMARGSRAAAGVLGRMARLRESSSFARGVDYGYILTRIRDRYMARYITFGE